MTHHIDGVGWWISLAAAGSDQADDVQPAACMRRHSSWHANLCRSSRVRMKSSLEQFSTRTMSRNLGVLRSASAAALIPAAFAV